MSSQIPACKDCQREGLTLRDCRIRIINFAVFNRKCPRELASVPVVTEAAKEARRAEAPTTYIPVVTPPPPPQEISSVPAAVEKVVSVTSDNIMVSNIPLDSLELGAFSPRMQFDPNYIAKLAEDIKAEGQLKAITVRPHPTEPHRYQVVDGEHRVRALQKLRWTLIRAEVHILSDEEAYYRAMRINQQHGKRLEDLEEACHISKMMAIFSLTQEQLAKRFSRPQKWVSERLSLAYKLAPETEQEIIRRRISTSHAIEIAELPKEEQAKVVEKVAEHRLRRAATRGLVHAFKEATPEQKEDILKKPLKVYEKEFGKEPKQMKKALLTIKPDDDFLKKAEGIKAEWESTEGVEKADEFFGKAEVEEPITTEKCPSCGKQIHIDWIKRETQWA